MMECLLETLPLVMFSWYYAVQNCENEMLYSKTHQKEAGHTGPGLEFETQHLQSHC